MTACPKCGQHYGPSLGGTNCLESRFPLAGSACLAGGLFVLDFYVFGWSLAASAAVAGGIGAANYAFMRFMKPKGRGEHTPT